MRVRLTLFLSAILAAAGVTMAAPVKPNILLIVADDLGWKDVGWHGGPFKTPHMDRLVAEGVELDQHYVQPLCTPTRAALMSGRYPSRFGPHALVPSNLRAMPLGTVTLAAGLKTMGYATYQTGKWHLGSRMEWGPNAFGFDHSYGSLSGAVDPWTHKYRQGEYVDTWHRDGRPLKEEGNVTELVAAQAEQWIRTLHEGPWFIYVPFHAVHIPVDAPERYKKLYDGVKFDDDAKNHDSRLRLGAFVSQMDAKIGAFMRALEESGQREKTLVVFASDNGGLARGANPYVGTTPGSPMNSDNTPLRGQKAELFEGGIRVCAFANWPGTLKPSKVRAPMHAVDWFPTLASLAGYEASADLRWDGMNMWPAISGAVQEVAPRTIYFPFKGSAIRKGEWKLIVPRKEPPMLFNLAADPYEKNDLAAAEPGRVEELRAALEELKRGDVHELPADLVGLHP